ncbi:MAG TPA: ABC transporter substrate-binding protein [Parasegetibacter sp.]
MKRIILAVFLAIVSFAQLSAQNTRALYNNYKHKIAVFAPLFLDSAYDGTSYKHGKNFPKYIIPGLEFYEGVQLALDSLAEEGVPLEVFIYDTRSASKSFSQQLQNLPDVEMIIGSVGATEVKPLADLAARRKIPFISATFPNDAGVTNNPYLVVLNSTLPTHVNAIYKHLQQNFRLGHLVYFKKKSSQDDWLKNLFTETAGSATGLPLKIKFVDVDAGFAPEAILSHLDTSKTNIVIAGSMDESFNRQLAITLAPYAKNYPTRLIGLPIWDGYRDLNKPEYSDLEIIYGAPLYNPRTDTLSVKITSHYRENFYSRPSDMVFWGYGATWKFAKLLLEYGNDIGSNLAVNRFNLFTELDIQPVINKQTNTLDYFENKKVYFITKVNGVIKNVR